VAGYENRFAIT